MVQYNFKKIPAIPNAKQFVDIVLTRTQRRTPTIVHKGYSITVLRKFYMRKVQFTKTTITDKLTQLLTDFPILDVRRPLGGLHWRDQPTISNCGADGLQASLLPFFPLQITPPLNAPANKC